jgi:hypothetical protein
MCSLDVRFTVASVFDVNCEFSTLKRTLKTHATVKRTSKLHIQNASVIHPLGKTVRDKEAIFFATMAPAAEKT